MARWWSALSGRLGVARKLLQFLWRERLWWMIPLIAVLLTLGLLLFVGMQTPLAPFIYTMF